MCVLYTATSLWWNQRFGSSENFYYLFFSFRCFSCHNFNCCVFFLVHSLQLMDFQWALNKIHVLPCFSIEKPKLFIFFDCHRFKRFACLRLDKRAQAKPLPCKVQTLITWIYMCVCYFEEFFNFLTDFLPLFVFFFCVFRRQWLCFERCIAALNRTSAFEWN